MRLSRKSTCICGGLFGALWVAFLGGQPEPGVVSTSLVHTLHLAPFASMAHPVWQLFAALLPSTYVIALLSAVSAGSLVLVGYLLGELATTWLPTSNEQGPSIEVWTGHLFTVFVVATSPLLWIAWRPIPALFDTVPVLGAVVLFSRYNAKGRWRHAWIGALLAGVGVVENPFLLTAAAILWLPVALAMKRHGHLHRNSLLIILLCCIVPILSALAGLYVWSGLDPSAAWRGATTPALRLRWIAAEAVAVFRQGYLATGWLYLMIVCWIPAAMSWALAVRRYRRRGVRRIWFVVATLPGLSLLLDLPFAPHRLVGVAPFPVLSVLAALTSLALCFRYGLHLLSDRLAPSRQLGLMRALLFVILLIGILQARRNQPVADHPALAAARETVASLAPGSILVTDGPLDDLLRIAARLHTQQLDLITLSRLGEEPYRRSIATLQTNAAWRTLIPVAPTAALRDALRADRSSERPLVLFAAQDWIVRAGRYAVPRPWGYEALDTLSATDLTQRVAVFEQANTTYAEAWARAATNGRPGTAEATAWLALFSRMANDLGVLAEQMEDYALAERLYGRARSLASPQPIATLNLALLLDHAGRMAETEPLWREVEQMGESATRRPGPASLSSRYGLLHSAEALRRWNDLDALPHASRPVAWNEAMRWYLRGDAQRAHDLLEPQLGPDAPPQAWLLYALCSADLRDDRGIERAADEMNRRQDVWGLVVALQGERALERGDEAKAVQQLEQALRLAPWNTRVLEAHLRLALHNGHYPEAERFVNRLLSLEPGNPWGNYALGLIHLKQEHPELAESAFLRVAGHEAIPLALNNLAWLLAQQQRYGEALGYARRAVAADPYGATLWDTLGVALAGLNHPDAARQAFDRALLLNPADAQAQRHRKELDAGGQPSVRD